MKHDAKAVGSGSEAAQAELQDQYQKVSHSHSPPFPFQPPTDFFPPPSPPTFPSSLFMRDRR
jgi:hypothetical protein